MLRSQFCKMRLFRVIFPQCVLCYRVDDRWVKLLPLQQFGEKFLAICSAFFASSQNGLQAKWTLNLSRCNRHIWMGVCGRQTDTQNTINFLPNHSIKTMKFMLSPPQKNLQRWRVAGGKKSQDFDMSQMVNWMDYKGWRRSYFQRETSFPGHQDKRKTVK